ncbi:hypothetical protein [Nitrosopumilus ureiphilus]|uniref:hypothetical protein n=1 Tax=Nitrosopumilus ureiphilus TaxID=1470067 RepID=UPI0015C72A51|nr:hypothetical protein [Nitrosopumilus ureiphilus]
MDKKFVLSGILTSILLGGILGQFSIEDSFADDNLSVSREDSDAYQKQIEKEEEKKQKAEERKQTLKEKEEEKKQKAEERKQKLEEEKKQKAEERKQKLEEEKKQKAEERKQKLEEKKRKLDFDRKKLAEKLSEKINKYEEKLREIKEKYQNRIESDFSGDAENLSTDVPKLTDKLGKKSEEIRKKLEEKQEKLDYRTQKILDKINDGDYLGDKIGASTTTETYNLVFDSVEATEIHDKTQSSTLEGFMNFNTFDKSKSNLKLELQDCYISVDGIPYNCGFGKARTAGNSGAKDSLVILAFLEDDVLEEVHSMLKISLNADFPIGDIEDSTKVSILGPQSKISGLWFLDGTGTLTRTVSSTDDSPDNSTGNEITVELTEDVGISGN